MPSKDCSTDSRVAVTGNTKKRPVLLKQKHEATSPCLSLQRLTLPYSALRCSALPCSTMPSPAEPLRLKPPGDAKKQKQKKQKLSEIMLPIATSRLMRSYICAVEIICDPDMRYWISFRSSALLHRTEITRQKSLPMRLYFAYLRTRRPTLPPDFTTHKNTVNRYM